MNTADIIAKIEACGLTVEQFLDHLFAPDSPRDCLAAYEAGRREALSEAAEWLQAQAEAILAHARKGGEAMRGRAMASTLDTARDHFRALAAKAGES